MRRVHEFYGTSEFAGVQPVSGAIQGFADLRRDYISIAITSRPLAIEGITRTQLDRHYRAGLAAIHHTNHFGVSGDKRTKVDFCREGGAELIVEDSPEIALQCYNAGIGVVLLQAPWNRKADLPNGIQRAKDWVEVVSRVRRALD